MRTYPFLPIEDRFWAYVEKTNGCWFWTGAKTHGGYGVIRRRKAEGGELVRAHRLSYCMQKGNIPPGMMVCHSCDTPSCVNPDHLFVGSQTDNMTDASIKMRTRGGTPPGSTHHRAKLVEPDVVAIRSIYPTGTTSLAKLAKQFGVSKRTVLNVVHRRIWVSV
jgi:hypothetical protein